MMMRRSKGSTTSKELPTNYNRLRHARLSPHPHIMGKAAGTALNGAASSTRPLIRSRETPLVVKTRRVSGLRLAAYEP
jgi:hypothetical protein